MSQLDRIKFKLNILKIQDSNYLLFGAAHHRYQLNPPLSMDTIRRFEALHDIKLPTGYVEFLSKIGNGGAGPFYGLEPLENGLFTDLDSKNPDLLLNLHAEFPHTEAWNIDMPPESEDDALYDQQIEDYYQTYYDPHHMNGALAICNYGCAVSIHLIVQGKEYGHIWTDDRSGNAGIYPSKELGNDRRVTFLDWYERWLDRYLENKDI
jgi:hypothetical protein